MNYIELIIAAVKTIAIFAMVLSLVPVLIWMERKGAAYIQDRRGPNRAAIFGVRLGGLVHSLADAIKLFTKEEVFADRAHRVLYIAAPMLAFFVAAATVAVVPFAGPLDIEGYSFTLQVANLNAGLIYVFAMSALGVFALIFAGFAAGSKYPLFGAVRASAQVISYELAMGTAALSIFILAGSFTLTDIISVQGAWPWNWNIIRAPLAFVIFITAMLAETNRLPFDLPEGESELVAGYHTEYSSMRFALFFMAEYAHIVVGSAILTALFFGGYNFPFASPAFMRDNAFYILIAVWPIAAIVLLMSGGVLSSKFKRKYHDARDFEPLVFGVPMILLGLALIITYVVTDNIWLPDIAAQLVVFFVQLGVFFVKTMMLAAFFIWIRWTLPRFRYDQLMRLGWKVLLPLGLVNALVLALWEIFRG